MKRTEIIDVVVMPAAMVFATSTFAGNEERIQWTDIPPAVQKTIARLTQAAEKSRKLRGNKTQKVKMLHFDGAKTVTVYEAEVEKPNGKEIEIKVGEDGKLIKIKQQKDIKQGAGCSLSSLND